VGRTVMNDCHLILVRVPLDRSRLHSSVYITARKEDTPPSKAAAKCQRQALWTDEKQGWENTGSCSSGEG